MTFTWTDVSPKTCKRKEKLCKCHVKNNESCLRISKTVNGVVHKYIYDGDLLISEQFGDTLLIYVYDEAGSPIGFKYRTTGYAIGAFDSYVFGKNLQGDIVAIYNTSGTAVATYKYDAWGNVISATGTMASVNPFRYRGYYYDIETGFYYLRSRYYDPAICRFINADNAISGTGESLQGYNLFSYCFNISRFLLYSFIIIAPYTNIICKRL